MFTPKEIGVSGTPKRIDIEYSEAEDKITARKKARTADRSDNARSTSIISLFLVSCSTPRCESKVSVVRAFLPIAIPERAQVIMKPINRSASTNR